jgi:Chaperone of endosialidase
MKRMLVLTTVLALLILLDATSRSGLAGLPQAVPATPLETAFAYQGYLTDGGQPANGNYDFKFDLYDVDTGGTSLGTVTLDSVVVANGYFTVALEFGTGVFNGEARWLAIGVRLPGYPNYTILTPRQALTAAPYATYASSTPWGGLIGAPGLWLLGGNTGLTPAESLLGTTDNVGITFVVSDTTALRLLPATVPNLIGGLSTNSVSPGVVGATISGGGQPGSPNQVQANYGTVGGGMGNTASGEYAATVGGGYLNTASGNSSTVGGGYLNIAGGTNSTVAGGIANTAPGDTATVGGGTSNAASGFIATVGGGQYNTASGDNATVAGGANNIAAGDYSFAAGWFARANNRGCFVWADSTELFEYVSCDVDNRWMARASGGVYFYTNSSLTSGMYLAAGGSSWNAASNPALKEHFAAIDTRALVQSLSSIPITTWNYKAQDASILHVGPMADDFNALLPGLGGEGEMSINSLDADGIALASIQGLYQMLQDKEAHIAELEKTLTNQQAQIGGLQAETGALRLQVEALKLGGMLASAGVLSPSTLFSALACLLAGAAFLRTHKKAHQ